MPTYSHYANELTADLTPLITKAREEASAHRPSTDATSMDQHETALQTDAERHLGNEHRLVSAVIAEANRSATELQQKAVELDSRVAQVLADESWTTAVEADMADDREKLIRAGELRMRREVDWRAFRKRHGIVDEADYPESKIWHFAIIAILGLAETAANAFFYQNNQGWIGGFVVAFAVACINLGGALGLGWSFRFKNLRDRTKQIQGWTSLAAFLVLTLYCNALFAAFRGQYQLLRDTGDAIQLRDAFTRATEDAGKIFVLRMHVPDLMSFILFGTGLLLSFFAFYKGYTADDRYPDHGKKDRAVKAAKTAEVELQEQVRQRVKDYLHNQRRELQALMHEPAQIVNSSAARMADLQQALATHATQQDAIQRDFSFALKKYRDENAAIRATDPPAYFGAIPELRRPPDADAIASVLDRLRAVQETARNLRDVQQASLNARLNTLQRDAAAILSETFGTFLAGVDAEAEERINKQIATIATPN